MAGIESKKPSYWRLLDAAEAALTEGSFADSERAYLEAADLRQHSPGRVFFTEKISDGLGRILSGGRHQKERDGLEGKWIRRSTAFKQQFLASGEKVVRQAIRLADLRPEDDAHANQPVLAAALFLVARSRIFQEETGSAIPLLKGLFRTARKTAIPFDVHLVRHDLPMTEEDRLWLAARGAELLEAFVEQGRIERGSRASEDWAQVIQQLIQERYFGSTGRLQEERCWLEAVTADKLLGRALQSVELYRSFLNLIPEPGPRSDEARVRLLELLGNTDAIHLSVPRYHDALAAMQAAGLAAGSAMTSRFETALARIEYRRPEEASHTGRSRSDGLAWATAGLESDGTVAMVFWWDAEPRDVAFWSPGQDIEPLMGFLEPCQGRIVAADPDVRPVLAEAWADGPVPWTTEDFLALVLESKLPPAGLKSPTVHRLGLGETEPWRRGWDPLLGNPLLEPPRGSTGMGSWPEGRLVGALQAGLGMLAVRSRFEGSDPALRAGIGEMSRRGNACAQFLYPFLTLDRDSESALDASFESWTIPLLWTRPDPFGWGGSSSKSGFESEDGQDLGARPDLGRNDLAIVTTGNPAAVLEAWGEGRQKWRVVLDRLDRLESLSRMAARVIGPVTLIPADGKVHDLGASLALLDTLLEQALDPEDSPLPIFHWIRLTETHNGDLLDYRQVRPRPRGAVPLHDRYAEIVADLPRRAPALESPDGPDTWAHQFSQRVRKAGLVAGGVDHLSPHPEELDSLWGVFEGCDASWVFLDSASIHWALLKRGEFGIREIHAALQERGWRHLSLLTAATWMRTELEELLATWLGAFGTPYCLSLTDASPPVLQLADRGIVPESVHRTAEGLAGQVGWVAARFKEAGPGTVIIPGQGLWGRFWLGLSQGQVAFSVAGWNFRLEQEVSTAAATAGGSDLVIPVLASLDGEAVPVAQADLPSEWRTADEERAAFTEWRRKLCALELAHHAAGPWKTVSVLDSRWWRLLREIELPGAKGSGEPLRGMSAAVIATAGTARTVDLLAEPGHDTRVADPIRAAINTWLADHGAGQLVAAESPDGFGATRQVPPPGRHLLLGSVEGIWNGLAQEASLAWDAGDFSRWILVISDTVQPGAAALVASSQASGMSIWRSDRSAMPPAPVLWARPEDLADPALATYLDRHRPATILAGDLGEWLPAADRDSQETAWALRTILDRASDRIVLYGTGLSAAWIQFLQLATRAQVLGGESQDEAAPTLSFDTEPRLAGNSGRALDSGAATTGAAVRHRLSDLLSSLESILKETGSAYGAMESGQAPGPGLRLIPLDWLGRLAGLPPQVVATDVVNLRWTARVFGDSLSDAGTVIESGERTRSGHSLCIPLRFAEVQALLQNLENNLRVLIPLWLKGVPAKTETWIDLQEPPARIPVPELTLVDEFLAAVADMNPEIGFQYEAPGGMVQSRERLMGLHGEPGQVLGEVLRVLQIFEHRLADVMSGAVETGRGFVVDTGLTELRTEELQFLSLGAALGLWEWSGPVCPGALHLVDLLTLAESSTVRHRAEGWGLLEDLHTQEAGTATDAGKSGEEKGRRWLGLRQFLASGGERSDDLDPAVAQVASFASGEGDSSILVLKGLAGTGRMEATVRGLKRARDQAPEPPRVIWWCPDRAVAAYLMKETALQVFPGPHDIRIVEENGIPVPQTAGMDGPVGKGAEVVVMCEIQRFDPETRYRVAQSGRGRRLLMTADPAAASETWENLFLTTPRQSDVLSLSVQRIQARRIWTEVASLIPSDFEVQANPRRKDRGELISGYAANLDQCLARITTEHQEGRLPDTMRLAAPLAADLDYLGQSLRQKGWVAVPESELEEWMLPGCREILAAATDALTLAGALKQNFGPPAPGELKTMEASLGNTGKVRDGDSDTDQETSPGMASTVDSNSGDLVDGVVALAQRADLLCPRILGPDAAREWCQTQAGRPVPDLDISLAEFVGQLRTTAWASSILSRKEARFRVRKLLSTWGDRTLADLPKYPVWEAWWYAQLDDHSVMGPQHRRPVVTLTETTRLPAGPVPGGIYLCLGVEPPLRHYGILSRFTDSCLLLYQERSPLPSDSQG